MGFLRGIAAFCGGVAFVVATPRLWLRALVPASTALVLVVALAVAGVRASVAIAHRALGEGVGADVLGFALAGAAVVLAFVVGVSLAQPLSGWALDGIVRAQEARLAAAPEPRAAGGALSSLASAVLAIAVGIPAVALLTALGWAFPPAAVATVPLKVVVAGVLLAWDLLDYPLAARGMTVGRRVRWCARHFGAVVGFGIAAAFVFAVPGVGLLALPCGVAGAARLVAGTTGGPPSRAGG